ncbi:MAG: FAD-dependent oxidoreductase, partial [Sulfuricella sp.]|nr:FAD-dependent oxidoreductase [Sulfuricella sp.]
MDSDFLIVGGGVIGLSSALELARGGATVTVL